MSSVYHFYITCIFIYIYIYYEFRKSLETRNIIGNTSRIQALKHLNVFLAEVLPTAHVQNVLPTARSEFRRSSA
jgi:hypothetical protein